MSIWLTAAGRFSFEFRQKTEIKKHHPIYLHAAHVSGSVFMHVCVSLQTKQPWA